MGVENEQRVVGVTFCTRARVRGFVLLCRGAAPVHCLNIKFFLLFL